MAQFGLHDSIADMKLIFTLRQISSDILPIMNAMKSELTLVKQLAQ